MPAERPTYILVNPADGSVLMDFTLSGAPYMSSERSAARELTLFEATQFQLDLRESGIEVHIALR